MPGTEPGQPVERFLTTARALVDAQVALDARHRESAHIQGEDPPPLAWKWGKCVLRVPIVMNVVPRTTAAGVNRACISPHQDERSGQLNLVVRHTSSAPGAEGEP